MQKLNKFKLPVNFRGRSAIIVQLWWIIDFWFFKSSPQIMYGWRRWLLRLFGAKIGKNVIIRPTVTVTYPWKVSIGENCMIGDDVNLYSLGEIEIGNNVVVSQKCYLASASHDYDKEYFPIWSKKITISDGCWLATDVYVGPGVNIGENTVVGARSSVFKDLPANKICVGTPAQVIKARVFKNLNVPE
jgi:putative colanic acid biosynthesis acetyltransferase WcaF